MRRRPCGDDTAVDSLRGHLLIAGPGARRSELLAHRRPRRRALRGGRARRRPEPHLRDARRRGGAGARRARRRDGRRARRRPGAASAIVVLADFAEPADADALVVGSVGFLPAEVDPDALGTAASRARLRRVRRLGPWPARRRARRGILDRRACAARTTCSRPSRTRSGARCSGAREARSASSRRCRPIPRRTERSATIRWSNRREEESDDRRRGARGCACRRVHGSIAQTGRCRLRRGEANPQRPDRQASGRDRSLPRCGRRCARDRRSHARSGSRSPYAAAATTWPAARARRAVS